MSFYVINLLVTSLAHEVPVMYLLTRSFFLSKIPVELCAKFPWFYSWHLLKPSSLLLYRSTLRWGPFHSLYYGILTISQLLFLSLASTSVSHSPVSTEMIFLKCKWDLALPYLKLLNWLFHTFHGSPLPNNRAQTLQSGTQSSVWSGFSLIFSSLYCHICSHAIYSIILNY